MIGCFPLYLFTDRNRSSHQGVTLMVQTGAFMTIAALRSLMQRRLRMQFPACELAFSKHLSRGLCAGPHFCNWPLQSTSMLVKMRWDI